MGRRVVAGRVGVELDVREEELRLRRDPLHPRPDPLPIRSLWSAQGTGGGEKWSGALGCPSSNSMYPKDVFFYCLGRVRSSTLPSLQLLQARRSNHATAVHRAHYECAHLVGRREVDLLVVDGQIWHEGQAGRGAGDVSAMPFLHEKQAQLESGKEELRTPTLHTKTNYELTTSSPVSPQGMKADMNCTTPLQTHHHIG